MAISSANVQGIQQGQGLLPQGMAAFQQAAILQGQNARDDFQRQLDTFNSQIDLSGGLESLVLFSPEVAQQYAAANQIDITQFQQKMAPVAAAIQSGDPNQINAALEPLQDSMSARNFNNLMGRVYQMFPGQQGQPSQTQTQGDPGAQVVNYNQPRPGATPPQRMQNSSVTLPTPQTQGPMQQVSPNSPLATQDAERGMSLWNVFKSYTDSYDPNQAGIPLVQPGNGRLNEASARELASQIQQQTGILIRPEDVNAAYAAFEQTYGQVADQGNVQAFTTLFDRLVQSPTAENTSGSTTPPNLQTPGGNTPTRITGADLVGRMVNPGTTESAELFRGNLEFLNPSSITNEDLFRYGQQLGLTGEFSRSDYDAIRQGLGAVVQAGQDPASFTVDQLMARGKETEYWKGRWANDDSGEDSVNIPAGTDAMTAGSGTMGAPPSGAVAAVQNIAQLSPAEQARLQSESDAAATEALAQTRQNMEAQIQQAQQQGVPRAQAERQVGLQYLQKEQAASRIAQNYFQRLQNDPELRTVISAMDPQFGAELYSNLTRDLQLRAATQEFKELLDTADARKAHDELMMQYETQLAELGIQGKWLDVGKSFLEYQMMQQGGDGETALQQALGKIAFLAQISQTVKGTELEGEYSDIVGPILNQVKAQDLNFAELQGFGAFFSRIFTPAAAQNAQLSPDTYNLLNRTYGGSSGAEIAQSLGAAPIDVNTFMNQFANQ